MTSLEAKVAVILEALNDEKYSLVTHDNGRTYLYSPHSKFHVPDEVMAYLVNHDLIYLTHPTKH